MSILNIARIEALATSVVLLMLIGLGPALHLLSPSRQKLTYAVFIAPALGFGIVGLLLYPVILSNHPLEAAAAPLSWGCVIVSLLLIATDMRRNFHTYWKNLEIRALVGGLLVLIIAFAILILPMLSDTIEHSFWQLIGWDATNYMAISWFAQHIPWNQASNPAYFQQIVQVNPGLTTVMAWLRTDRPVTMFALAFLSSLHNTPVYYFYYPFKLLSFLLLAGVGLAVTRQIRLRGWLQYAVILVIAVGYWAQFVNSSDAASQINGLPLALLCLFAWTQLETERPGAIFSRQRFFLALSLASLLSYYPEFTPLLAVAFLIYHLLRLSRHIGSSTLREEVAHGLKHLSTILMVVVLVLPSIVFIAPFLLTQINDAAGSGYKGVSDTLYFWLFDREMLSKGLWGLQFYRNYSDDLLRQNLSLLVTAVIGGVLSLLLSVGVIRIFFRRPRAVRLQLLAACVMAFWGGGILLHLLSKDYASGKAFGMGYAFATIALFLVVKSLTDRWNLRWTRRTVVYRSLLLRSLLVLWIILQLIVPVFWAHAYSIRGQAFDSIAQVIDYLHNKPFTLLASDFTSEDSIVAQDWNLMLGDQFNYLPLGGMPAPYYYEPLTWWKQSDQIPDLLLLPRDSDYLAAAGTAHKVYENDLLVLYAMTAADFDHALVQSSIMPEDQGSAIRFSGADEATTVKQDAGYQLKADKAILHFISSGQNGVTLRVGFKSAVSGTLVVLLNGKPIQNQNIVAGAEQVKYLNVYPKSGTNTVMLSVVTNGVSQTLLYSLSIAPPLTVF